MFRGGQRGVGFAFIGRVWFLHFIQFLLIWLMK